MHFYTGSSGKYVILGTMLMCDSYPKLCSRRKSLTSPQTLNFQQMKSCTVFPRLTPLESHFPHNLLRGSYWEGSYSWGGVILSMSSFHFWCSGGPKFIWNLCKIKLFTSKTRPLVCMMSSPWSYSRKGVIFSKPAPRGGVNREGRLFKGGGD